ncbi:MAG: hypothetical protein ACI9TH_001253 [Kiritimatiellia bacterium]|jgi:uncharacterized protein (DUF1501 family)
MASALLREIYGFRSSAWPTENDTMSKDVVTWAEDPAHFTRTRRDFLQVGAIGALGLTLGDALRMEAHGAQKFYESKEGPAKSVIQIVLGGGMSAQESWDPKPDAPIEYRGPMGVCKTSIPGVVFGETMQNCAKIADKMTIIRSMQGKEADHNRASYTLYTGYRMSPALKHPSMGAVVSHEFGPKNDLPAYMAVPKANDLGGTGYLSPQYGAFSMGGDPSRSDFKVSNMTLPTSVSDERFTRRRKMRDAVEDHFRSLETNPSAIDAMDEFYQRAYTMISSPNARKAFDIQSEPKAMKEKYGLNKTGMQILLARRLVEAGVRFITISVGSWDHHNRIKDAFGKTMPPLDQAFAALITDLEDRGLLDSTLVFMSGEFGRTPKINKQAGRDHYAKVWSMAMAGGGISKGKIYGASDATSIEVETDPVTMPDALTTVYQQMGVNADKELMAPGARPIEIVNGGKVIDGLVG